MPSPPKIGTTPYSKKNTVNARKTTASRVVAQARKLLPRLCRVFSCGRSGVTGDSPSDPIFSRSPKTQAGLRAVRPADRKKTKQIVFFRKRPVLPTESLLCVQSGSRLSDRRGLIPKEKSEGRMARHWRGDSR